MRGVPGWTHRWRRSARRSWVEREILVTTDDGTPEIVAALTAELDRIETTAPVPVHAPPPSPAPLLPPVEERLRALGYLGESDLEELESMKYGP